MRMISQFRDHNRVRGRRTVTMLVLVFLFLLGVQFLSPSMLPSALYYVGVPFWWTRDHISDALVPVQTLFLSKSFLLKENERLHNELKSAQSALLEMKADDSAFEALRPLLSKKLDETGVLSAVLSKPPFVPYDTLVLDLGNTDGIAVGDVVRSVGGVAIGRITESFRKFSRATLFSSPGTENVVLIGSKGIEAKTLGVGGGMFQALLPREVELREGDIVTLPGMRPAVLGVVSTIEYRDVDFLQLVSFRSPVTIAELRYVTIERSGERENYDVSENN